MLGKFGETLVVIWGLARLRGEGEGVEAIVGDENPLGFGSEGERPATEAGSIFGPPGFMSLEQAGGDLDRPGPASDVCNLGATLFILLTGKPAPAEGPVAARLDRARRGDFPPPRAVSADVPATLEAICLKPMALKVEDDYPTALALSYDPEQRPCPCSAEPWRSAEGWSATTPSGPASGPAWP